jgi:hypothetical protein
MPRAGGSNPSTAPTPGNQPGQGTQPGGAQAGDQPSGPDAATKPSGAPGGGRVPGSRPGADRGEGQGNNAAGGNGNTPSTPGPDKQVKGEAPPPAEPPPANPDDLPAPDSGAMLTIRKINDLLKDNKFTPDVEKKLGMSRDEAEQFVKPYEKALKPRGPVREAREIKVDPNKPERKFDPNRKAPEALPDVATSKSNERSGNVVPTDELHGLSQGSQSPVPKALQKRMSAYNDSLARSPVTAPARRSAPANSGGTNP